MKAIFLKELRENFKWAVVIFGALGVFIYFQEIREARSNFFFHIVDPGITLIPIALAGLLLGIAQSLFEIRPDNWAFIIQRPMSRLSIFVAKCAAGLLLLYAAVSLPCILAAIWGATPGHLTMPFQWRMVLPMVAIVLAAGPFYFAGVTLTLRKARWFGTRLLSLGLAILCSLVVLNAPQFWQTALFTMFVIPIGAAAAWDVYSTAGACDRNGVSSFALGTTIFTGALGISCLLVALLDVFQSKVIWHDQRVDRDGNVLRITWTLDGRERTTVVTDIEGHVLPQYEGLDIDDTGGESTDRFARLSSGMIDEQRIDMPFALEADMRGYRIPSPAIVGLRSVGKTGVRFRRTCMFDGLEQIIDVYDPVTRMLLGKVGPAGFTSGDALPKERFTGTSLNPMAQGNTHTLAFPLVVYWMELDQQRVRPIYTAAPGDPVIAATEMLPQTAPTVAVITRKNLYVMQPSGESIFSAAHHLDLSNYWLAVGRLTSSGNVLLQANPLPWKTDPVPPYHLLEFGKDGTLARETVAPPMAAVANATKLRRIAMMGAVYPLAGRPLLAPWFMDETFELDIRGHATLFSSFQIGSAILCVVLTLVVSRQCGFGAAKTATWSLANGLLGPAGVVTMLGLNAWPAREHCASCGGKRLVGRRECSRCGAPLTPPPHNGREIFEPEDAFQQAI